MKDQAVTQNGNMVSTKNWVNELAEGLDSENSPVGEGPLELFIREPKEALRIDGVVIGQLIAVGNSGETWVNFSLNPERQPLPARSAAVFQKTDVGCSVALLFENGDPRRPIVVGPLYQPENLPESREDEKGMEESFREEIHIDAERIIFSAQKEIVLDCGEASIILTRAGKILIRGKYLLSRSEGVNRIKGGSVQIN